MRKFAKMYLGYCRLNRYQLGIGYPHHGYKDFLPDQTPEFIQAVIRRIRKSQQSRTDYWSVSHGRQAALDLSLRNAITVSPGSSLGDEYWDIVYRGEQTERKLEREIDAHVENMTRAEFGYKEIGSRFQGETTLFILTKGLFPRHEVKRHFRPKWLELLELDIFLPEINLGIEFQGQQHYQSIEAWGGEEAYQALRKRDERKKALCKANNVHLVEVRFDEPLDRDHIASRLKKWL